MWRLQTLDAFRVVLVRGPDTCAITRDSCAACAMTLPWRQQRILSRCVSVAFCSDLRARAQALMAPKKKHASSTSNATADAERPLCGMLVNEPQLSKFKTGRTWELRQTNRTGLSPGERLYIFESGSNLKVFRRTAYVLHYSAEWVGARQLTLGDIYMNQDKHQLTRAELIELLPQLSHVSGRSMPVKVYAWQLTYVGAVWPQCVLPYGGEPAWVLGCLVRTKAT